jgi:hypothetical protein
MVRPDLVEAYARRLVASLCLGLGSRVAAVQRTISESPRGDVMEWKAVLESGAEIRLSAAILRGAPPSRAASIPVQASRSDAEFLREMGISPEDSVPK